MNSGGREHADHAPAKEIKTQEAGRLQHGKDEMASTAKVGKVPGERIQAGAFQDIHLKGGSVVLFLRDLPGGGMAEDVVGIGGEKAMGASNSKVGAQAQGLAIECEIHRHSVTHCNAKSRALTLRE